MASEVGTKVAFKTVRVGELPNAENMTFPESAFFKSNRTSLPSPAEVREESLRVRGSITKSSRPPPVLFKEMGLIVKYGSEITIAEAQCLVFFNRYMKDQVPTPELLGWRRDGDETFIYMELVEGETMEDAWPTLDQQDQDAICEQLRTCVEAWRTLRQETEPYYIGHIGRQGVGDVFFSFGGDAHAGPFENLTQFHDFFARYSCRRHPEWDPREVFPELAGMTDDKPVVFTHGDLDMSNILILRGDGHCPARVAAIIDWHQSGWYPVDWEWLKARAMCRYLDEGGRDTAWLEKIIHPADPAYVMAWEFVIASLGF
ncbi:kinase-like domain-containing protein [Hypoxylon sp. NC1633]|nr:kinase-like domain-containing protein [Hypoxylon sp. NC1633]